ncbi:MAG: hypothetical protein KTR31_24735 [Myxococcales bacterium]|nr:hypothetical protein [Myxococcales bacterium]
MSPPHSTAALRFTARGVVAAPETLQIRVGAQFEGRVAFGAPSPSRDMTPAEVVHNVRAFRAPGPRMRAVRGLALSAIPVSWSAATLHDTTEACRAAGIERVVLHRPVSACHDAVPEGVAVATAVRVPDEAEQVAAKRPSHSLSVTIPLEARVLPLLGEVAARLAPTTRLTLLWPLPGGSEAAPPADAVVEAMERALPQLASRDWGVKGLPLCALQSLLPQVPDLPRRVWKSANRHYVDADHQGPGALLLQPDLQRLEKRDGCRFCAFDSRCEGVASPWLAAGLAGAVTPISSSPTLLASGVHFRGDGTAG